jgi:2,3-bisphosphoglycerate-independent phosphoglycerate mutase
MKKQARDELIKKVTNDVIQKRKNKDEKKRILEVNRKVKQQLVSFQQKMSKRRALMKNLVKLKHKVEKTNPYYVGTKTNAQKRTTEDDIINEFIFNNKEIKKMTTKLKSMRTMRRPSMFTNLTKKKLLKGNFLCEIFFLN